MGRDRGGFRRPLGRQAVNPVEWERTRRTLMRHEGLRLKPYRDTVGKLTIGYGRNLDARGISREEAEHLLENDMQDHWNALILALPWVVSELNGVRQGVLLNMAFNLGIAGLLGFKATLSAIRDKHWSEAKRRMLQSKWATQVGPRATYLANLMEKGVEE